MLLTSASTPGYIHTVLAGRQTGNGSLIMRLILETKAGSENLPDGFVEVWPNLNYDDVTLLDALLAEIQACVETQRGKSN